MKVADSVHLKGDLKCSPHKNRKKRWGENDSRVKKHKGEDGAKQCRKSKGGGGICVCVCEPVYFPQTSVGDEKRGRVIMLREMEEVRHDGYIVMGHNDSVQYIRIISAN